MGPTSPLRAVLAQRQGWVYAGLPHSNRGGHSALQHRRRQHLAVAKLPLQRDRPRIAVLHQEPRAGDVGLPPRRIIQHVAQTADGRIESFTILTTALGPDCAPYHNRQPVTLERDQWATWLDLSADPAPCMTAGLEGGAIAVERATENASTP
jgi:hypothetical protein